ncbi:methylenetetrahydrofolate reductase [NAD(P)H] [Paracoccaceae bacterium GXU_MW_L88]
MTPKTDETSLSFEFFPPQTDAAEARLWKSVVRLAPLNPRFVSVTYGAGGTTRERTTRIIKELSRYTELDIAGHLTCVGATKEETLEVARDYLAAGVTGIVALRGDPPKGAEKWEPHPGGFASAAELVAALRSLGPLDIAVGGYPEKHPEAASLDADVEALKIKTDAGATHVITQFFFDNEDFLRFRDKAADAGITAEIMPGLLTIENFTKSAGFARKCGARIPTWMETRFAGRETDRDLSIATTVSQAEKLMREGVRHLHFYTLNNPDLTWGVARGLGFTKD